MSENLIPFDSGGEELIPFDVNAIPVVSVELTVPTPALEVGTTGSASVIVRGTGNIRLPGRTVTWSSSNDTVIADPSAGVTGSDGRAAVTLPALAAGTTGLKAVCEGVESASVTVTVHAVADPPTYDAVGATTIEVTATDRLASWARPRVRRFNDADQKRYYPNDRFFEGLEESVDVEIVWPSKELLRRWAK